MGTSGRFDTRCMDGRHGQVCGVYRAAQAMISSLVPAGVVAVEAFADQWETRLLPEERSVVVAAVEKRRQEFAAGRNCARRSLAQLGWPDFQLLSGANREPLWPPGVLGSITHCADYCGAAAAKSAELDGIHGIGIDAELNAPLPEDVTRLVCTPWELQSVVETPGVSLPALVFSAKESAYKAWFPVARCWLGYQDAEIDFDLPRAKFSVRLLPSAPPEGLRLRIMLDGRFATTATHIFTVVTARTGVSRITG